MYIKSRLQFQFFDLHPATFLPWNRRSNSKFTLKPRQLKLLGEASVQGKLWRHTGRKSFQRRNSSVSFLVFALAKEAKMPDRSVVYGCSNAKEPENGISLHKIPYYKNDGSVAQDRKKKWVDLVKLEARKVAIKCMLLCVFVPLRSRRFCRNICVCHS